MSQIEKLTELLDAAFLNCDDNYGMPSANQVADYLLENGVVVLPCKVGDYVYVLNRNKTRVQKMVGEAPDIRCVCVDEDNLCMATCKDRDYGVCAHRFRNDLSEFGKTVFSTREEAEAALKKIQEGDK